MCSAPPKVLIVSGQVHLRVIGLTKRTMGVATVGIGLLHTRVSLKSECRSKLDNVLLVQWGIESYLYRTCSESYIRFSVYFRITSRVREFEARVLSKHAI